MGAVRRAADLQRILEEKEIQLPDRDMYKMLKLGLQMELGNNHRFRGDFNAASKKTSESLENRY